MRRIQRFGLLLAKRFSGGCHALMRRPRFGVAAGFRCRRFARRLGARRIRFK
jgi:hypothetical protein